MLDNLTEYTAAALTLDAPALKRALAMAGLAFERKNRIPVLAAVKATVCPGSLTIAATDLDLQISVTIPADTEDHATAVFNPTAAAAAVAKVKGKAAILFDGEQMILEAGGATLDGKDGFPVDKFPTMPPALYQGRATMPASVLLAALQCVNPAISTEATRYYLNGVYFHGWQACHDGPATLRLVATDGHRLARYDLPAPWPASCANDDRGGMIVPRKTCEVLARILKDAGDTEIAIATDHTHGQKIMFSGDGWRIESKVIDGTFPDYTRVIPSATPSMTFIVAASDLPALGRGKPTLAIKLDATEGRMTWRDGDTVAARDLLAEGEGATGFNARYLADFAKVAPDGLTIEASGSGDPARALTSDPRFLGVVMPMRV